MRNPALLIVGCMTASLPVTSPAHHSFVGFYDQTQIIEIDGVLRSADWRNPHGRLRVDVTNEDGSVTQWHVETGSVSVLRVRGLDREFVRPGERIRIAGELALRVDHGLYARNMLLPDGKEVMLSIGIAPRWTDAATGELLQPQYDENQRAAAAQAADGIFRVWSTVLDDPASFPLFKGGYPMTAAAIERKSQWDASDVVQLGCVDKGMPALMITPYPIEFIDEGERIVIRFEEDNAVRTIDLRDNSGAAAPSPLGHSTGRWAEDRALIVSTNAISSGVLEYEGTPLSGAAELVETFSMTADQQRLDYTLQVTDPMYFSRPFELQRYFVWRPELSVQPYECVVTP